MLKKQHGICYICVIAGLRVTCEGAGAERKVAGVWGNVGNTVIIIINNIRLQAPVDGIFLQSVCPPCLRPS